ncbi:MAG: hypothetical protein JNK72_00540 [Myxococcales bacterium]|nr:hypothetical protein [Myxococcales bacterium]
MSAVKAGDPRPDETFALLREAALDGLELADEAGVEAAEAEVVAKKPKAVDPAVAALFSPEVTELGAKIQQWSKVWREATQREAPSIERLATEGQIARVDADLLSGYVAVVTEAETWRAFLPREDVTAVLALLLRRRVDEVAATLAEGPGSLAPRG